MARKKRDIPRSGNLKSEYHDEYLVEDAYCVFHEHEDSERGDLDRIEIPLPKLEEWYSKMLGREVSRDEALMMVDGYGLAPKDQKFTYQEMPQKLKMIHEVVFQKKKEQLGAKFKSAADVDDYLIYEELETNQDYYADEILWIKKQIKRRYYGYWCFIKGKPTYLNGANYFFLNFWWVANFGKNKNRPDYRDYQRMMFHMLMYAYTTTDSFYKYRVIYRENGVVKSTYRNSTMEDIGDEFKELGYDYVIEKLNKVVKTDKRTVHGINFVSSRRVAKTAISCCFCVWGTLNMPEQTFVIQAMNEDQAIGKIFVKQIQRPVSRLPFFFRPQFKGRLEAENGMKFQYDSSLAVMARAGLLPEQMDCFITPGASTEKAFDGEMEIAFVYRDEAAKKTDASAKDQNIPSWWFNTMKPAIERGDNIRGFAILPSTVGDMDTGGGAQFLDIVNMSHFSDRNDIGTTDSGLINFFLPGFYAVEGFIDVYGQSIVEDPPEPVLTNEGLYKSIGAKTYLKAKADSLERKGQWKKLIQHQQNFPFYWRDAFAVVPKDMGLPIEKMRERLKDLKFLRTPITTRINLKWVGGIFGGEVYTEIDPNGDWVMSYLPPKQFWNRKTVVSPDEGYIPPPNSNVIYAPEAAVSGKFYLAADPVKFNKRNTKEGNKKSKPAAAMFYKQDALVDMVDGQWKPRSEWVSNDWNMYYMKQVEDKNAYHEEWLKACILTGAYLYPEWPDGEDVVEYFREKGFDGYLLKDMGVDGKVESRPGVWATGDTINTMIGDVMTYFENNVRYVKIYQIIEEWTQMRGVDDLTNRDLCAASGWCLRAIKSRLADIYSEIREVVEVQGNFDTFDAF